jgi:hypothetical protein
LGLCRRRRIHCHFHLFYALTRIAPALPHRS